MLGEKFHYVFNMAYIYNKILCNTTIKKSIIKTKNDKI